MVSNYMCDVEVHIAFNAGFTTPAASRTWTDVSAYVELHDLLNITFGRQDEHSTAGPNTLTLTLDNTDGRFTALRSASPYYPNVKIGRPIRVRVTPPGGSVVTRFVGFIDEWPVEWDGTDAYAKASIRASSRMARLGLSAKLRSMIETEILAPRPTRYWTLGDPGGSTAVADSSGNGGTLLPVTTFSGRTDPVFGNAIGPGTDGLTAAEFGGSNSNGQWLASGDLGVLALPSGPQSLRAWVLVTGALSGGDAIIASTGNATIQLLVSTAGLLKGLSTTGPNINDGRGHDVAVVRDGTNEILYLDGVQVATAASGAPAAGAGMVIGWPISTIAHVAAYSVALTPTQVAAQAAVTLLGAAGDRTDQRLVRILAWVGVAATEVTTDTGAETMTYQQTSGQSVVDALRDVESTEGGVLFDDRDGNVRFRNRSHRYLATAVATLNMAAQHVGSDYSPKLDRSALINDAEVSNPTTGEKARSTSTTSSDEYGIATASATSVASTSDPLFQKAAWLVASYAEPRMRVPSLTVDVLAHQGLTPSAQTLLGITVGDLLAVSNAPTQSDTTSPSYFVEGYTEVIGPESYFITFNLSPTYPTLNTFVIGDATRGQLDSTYVLGL
jgi:hypothetical protein